MALVKFKRGTNDKFKSITTEDGTFYIITDKEKEKVKVYLGTTGNPIPLGSSESIVKVWTREIEGDTKKFQLVFSDLNGTETMVDLDKEKFVRSAKLSDDGKTLYLTLTDDTTVDIDLTVLTNATTVKVTKDITVNLGSGNSVGGFKNGDTISANTSIQDFITKLLAKSVPPTYTKPTLVLSNNGGTLNGNYEVGSKITPTIKANFTQNDAGALSSIQFKKDGTNVGTGTSYSGTAFYLTESSVTYTATATYAEGPIKNDNLGNPISTGHIAAGSVNSGNYTFTLYWQGYFAGSVTNTDAPTSATIRALGYKKNAGYAAGTFDFTVAAGAKQVIIAYPADKNGVSKVFNNTTNTDITNVFSTPITVSVKDANNNLTKSYKVWTYVPDTAYTQNAELTVTLG